MEADLELSGEQMRTLARQALDRIVEHIETLPGQPSNGTEAAPPEGWSALEPIPEEGSDFDGLLSFLFDRCVPPSFNTAGPGYMAYIPGGGLFATALADLVSDSFNRYVGLWQAAPALARLELNVGRWFCDLAAFPPGAMGLLTSGGSMSNLIAVVTARSTRLPEDFLGGTVYVSDQVHHSIRKAARLAGLPARNVRSVESDAEFRMSTADLVQQVRADRAAGLQPFMVVGSAGTTNTGAIDDLAELARIAAQENLWFHVDAAYGGFFLLTERGRARMSGIERSDSVTLDPHKALFLPYGTGSLLVRDSSTLRKTHQTHAGYLPADTTDEEALDFFQHSPELTRSFRGLRVWLPLKLHGARRFRESLDEKLDLAELALKGLKETPGIEIIANPQLTIVSFSCAPARLSTEESDRLNREVLGRINRRQRVFLSGSHLRNRFVIRVCVLSFRTHQDRVEAFLEDLRHAMTEVGLLPSGTCTPDGSGV